MALRRATLVVLIVLSTVPLAASAKCSKADLTADLTVGPMIGFLPTGPATASDRARAARRLREIRALVAPYRHGATGAFGGVLPNGLYVRHPPAPLTSHGPHDLLYRTTQGRKGAALELAAVQYEFPRDTSREQLDEVLPVSIARWHQLTYHCTAPPRMSWLAIVFPYATGDDAIWRALETPRFVTVAPALP